MTDFRIPLYVYGPSQPRREFLKQAGAMALAASAVPLWSRESAAAESDGKTPETLVSILFETLTPAQKKAVCFDWDHIDGNRGLLRTRLENNWKITRPSIFDASSDLQQLRADRARLSFRHLGTGQAELSQRHVQHVRHCREQQTQLIGSHSVSARAIGEQVQLLLLDAVFHFPPSTVAAFVQRLRIDTIGRQRRHHEARVRSFRQVFGFTNNAAFARPRLPSFVVEVFEDARCVAGFSELQLSLVQLAADDLRQPFVLGQSDDVVDVVVFTPRKNRVATEPAVGPDNDFHVRPCGPQLRDDPREFLHRAGVAVNVRRSHHRAQRPGAQPGLLYVVVVG